MNPNIPEEASTATTKLGFLKDALRNRSTEATVFPLVVFVFQVIVVILFLVFVGYGSVDNEAQYGAKTTKMSYFYKSYSDVAVMMFVGFGFLMTFLKKYAYGSIGLTFLLTCVCIEWTVLNYGLWLNISGQNSSSNISLDLPMLIQSLFGSAAVLISFGAVIGKVTPTQLLIMAIIEIPLYCLNCYIGYMVLFTSDVGGSMFIHTFGAYFGLVVSAFVSPKESKHGHPNKTTRYYNDIFSLIGTIFLWIYWPSFNSAISQQWNQQIVVSNTVSSLVGSCIATFLISRVIRPHGQFEMEDVQNATLAGGVAIGASADITIGPGGAMIVGMIAGTISTLGFRFLTSKLEQVIKLNDSCGVNNLHGMPGVFGGIVSIISSAIYSSEDIFVRGNDQPWYQLATLAHTIGIAVLGGAATGFLLKSILPAKTYYNDAEFWHVPSDFEILVTKGNEEQEVNHAAIVELIQDEKKSESNQKVTSRKTQDVSVFDPCEEL
jgi:ammonium transporter Rh